MPNCLLCLLTTNNNHPLLVKHGCREYISFTFSKYLPLLQVQFAPVTPILSLDANSLPLHAPLVGAVITWQPESKASTAQFCLCILLRHFYVHLSSLCALTSASATHCTHADVHNSIPPLRALALHSRKRRARAYDAVRHSCRLRTSLAAVGIMVMY